MTISFVVPYVPIPRIVKRINVAKSVDDVSLIYWDRGTESTDNNFVDPEVKTNPVYLQANEGNPFKRIMQTLKFIVKVIRFLKKESPEVIHVTKTDMLLGVYIYCVITKSNSKVIYEVSDIHAYALSNNNNLKSKIIEKILYLIEKLCFNIVDKLIVTSPYFWRNYYNKLIAEENVVFLPNTPNQELFRDYKEGNNKKFTVSFIGKIRYIEQIKLLIDVSKEADINVLIAGNGIGLEEIKKYSQDKPNIQIYGSYNYNKEIAKLYSLTDAVYSVYDTEIENVKIALPNRLYEAAYCGLPLLVSKGTYLEEIVINNQLGTSVNPNSFDNLYEEIMKLKNGNNTYTKKGKEFYSKYNSFTNFEILKNTYLELLY